MVPFRKSTRFFLLLPPSDRTVLALLALALLVAATGLPSGRDGLPVLLILQAALLFGFAACTILWMRWERRPFVELMRPAVTVAVIFILYTSLGKLGIAAMPYLADATLSHLDTALFGMDPSLWIQRYQTPAWVEFFSFIYGAFIPYIYLSITLGCLGRPPVERDQFLTGWVFTYAISYLGYLFVPAQGPVVYHAGDYDVVLPGRFFYEAVVRGVEQSGGLQGAFPSLHVGGSVYLCLFDLKTNRLRGLTYLPMVLLIYLATLFLRYHYVVDLIAGTIIAAGCVPLGQRAFMHWMQRRQAAGLPALPGGEGDALPTVSGADTPDAAYLFSAS